MKKNLLLLLCILVTTAYAEDYTYPYMVFTNSSGTQTVVAVDQLEITFADGNLVATNNTGTQTQLSLSDLASMHFTKESELPTGIRAMLPEEFNRKSATFYDLSGRRALLKGDSAPMRKGVYVVRKADGSTSKITVK